MNENELDWIDVFMSESPTEWDEFWGEVVEFARQHHISTRYVEEEFIIDGELITKTS